jgi:hypothetical protein
MTKPSQESGRAAPERNFQGPFLFCDYWASVLNLRDIVNLRALSSTKLSLEVFRKILNRPSAGLPRLGFYVIGSLVRPWLALWRWLVRLVGIKAKMPTTRYERDVMRNLLVEYAMRVEPKIRGLADVYAEGRSVASDVINPFRLKASSSVFLARYKIFLASAVALGWAALVNLVSRLFHAEATIQPYLGVLFYPIVLLILWWMFDDLLTATVSPLPLIAMRIIVRSTHGFQGFVVAFVLTACIIYLVEWFFIPRSLPAALYFYVNDDKSPEFPYKRGHNPYWLAGKYYWVWRYVTLAPAELLKFWEKDWERLEIWVRGEGEDRGKIEYVVTDTHYRELWFKYENLVGKTAADYHAAVLRRDRDTDKMINWVVDMDMDLVFHTPVVRGIYVSSGRGLSAGRRLLAILGIIFRKRPAENPERYKPRLEALEIAGEHLLDDIPEHFRALITHKLLSLPWSYWRFPRGAKSARNLPVYGGPGALEFQSEFASDRRYQIKQPDPVWSLAAERDRPAGQEQPPATSEPDYPSVTL